jgi:hypothetical protein
MRLRPFLILLVQRNTSDAGSVNPQISADYPKGSFRRLTWQPRRRYC